MLQGGEGQYDEMEYEDEVQDDEELPADALQDEDEKEAAVSFFCNQGIPNMD